MIAAALTTSKTKVDGCLVLETPVHSDMRGTFQELCNPNLEEALRLGFNPWVQDNFSWSRKNVLRGLHVQSRDPQGKLVRALYGTILDVCLDVREDSPTFGMFHGELLFAGKAMFLPPGTAHGFHVISDEAMVHYKCTSLYNSAYDGGILWDDPEVGIPWGKINPIVSVKDQSLPKLSDYLASL